jgi:hypothetical protein
LLNAQTKRGLRITGLVAVAVAVVIVALIPALLVLQAFNRDGQQSVLAQCSEIKAAKSAAVSDENIQLEANRQRPSLTIALADRQTASDAISFNSKGGLRIPDVQKARTSARFLEPLRRSSSEPLDSKVAARAQPLAGGSVMQLSVCVKRGELLKAGSYQGSVRIYGPRVNNFDYAVVVTQKWPWQIAVATLWYAGLAFIVAAWATGSLTFDPSRKGVSKWIVTGAGVLVGLVAMAPAFFGSYWNNPTWGSDPGPHIIGLLTAGLTAALAGLAAAQKFMRKTPSAPAGAPSASAGTPSAPTPAGPTGGSPPATGPPAANPSAAPARRRGRRRRTT